MWLIIGESISYTTTLLQEGLTLLWWACELGRSNLAIVLLDSGANVDLPTNVSNLTMCM